jgi:dihydrofolate reductase
MQKFFIVAVGKNYEIGKDNGLLWNIKEDMMLFKNLTIGEGNNAVVMGRNTYESIPEKYRPLNSRVNIVVSSAESIPGAYVAKSVDEAIDLAESLGCDNLWFIGGKRIYEEAVWKCDGASITRVENEFNDADVKLNVLEGIGHYYNKIKDTELNDDTYNCRAEIWERIKYTPE